MRSKFKGDDWMVGLLALLDERPELRGVGISHIADIARD
jgi:hypothetical protein